MSQTTYSFTQSLAGAEPFTLSESGLDVATTAKSGNDVTGDYTLGTTGSDTYTLMESGVADGGSFTATVTGVDNYTVTESGNTSQQVYQRTTTGDGTYDREVSGSEATLGSLLGTNGYTVVVSGNDRAGHFQEETDGTTRYQLLPLFADVSNTSNGTSPGNVTFYSHGLPFRDPSPNDLIEESLANPLIREKIRARINQRYPGLGDAFVDSPTFRQVVYAATDPQVKEGIDSTIKFLEDTKDVLKWINPLTPVKLFARGNIYLLDKGIEKADAQGATDAATYMRVCRGYWRALDSTSDFASPAAPIILFLTGWHEAERFFKAYEASRGGSDNNIAESLVLASAFVLADFLGATDINEIGAGKTVFENEPLTLDEKIDRGYSAIGKFVGAVQGGVSVWDTLRSLRSPRPTTGTPGAEPPAAPNTKSPPLHELVQQFLKGEKKSNFGSQLVEVQKKITKAVEQPQAPNVVPEQPGAKGPIPPLPVLPGNGQQAPTPQAAGAGQGNQPPSPPVTAATGGDDPGKNEEPINKRYLIVDGTMNGKTGYKLRAYASQIAQNTIPTEDFFEEFCV